MEWVKLMIVINTKQLSNSLLSMHKWCINGSGSGEFGAPSDVACDTGSTDMSLIFPTTVFKCSPRRESL
jgi:hypothetical protein